MSSLRTDWKGVFPPIVTPFTETEEIDEAAFRKVIDLLIEEGVHGIVVAGSTGEWYSLADTEVSRLLEVAKEQIADRVPLLAGTSSMSTRHAVALTASSGRSWQAAHRPTCGGGVASLYMSQYAWGGT